LPGGKHRACFEDSVDKRGLFTCNDVEVGGHRGDLACGAQLVRRDVRQPDVVNQALLA